MSAAVPQSATELADPAEEPGGQPPRRRRKALVATGGVVVLAAAATVVGLTRPFGGSSQPASGAADNGSPTAQATVTRQSVSAQVSADATLGYAGSYSVVNQAHGTLTALPAVGKVVREGRALYQVNGSGVVLLYGAVPVYRNLSQGMSGPDVHQLNRDLVALGDATRSELKPQSHYFSARTATALEKLQQHLGVQQTGSVSLGQVVFLPTAARITAVSGTLGGTAGPGPLLSASSTTRQVSIDLDASEQSYVKVGDLVTITMPNRRTTPGRVSAVGKVATTPSSSSSSSSSSPTVTVEITPLHPAATGSLDQAPVQVAITTATANNVLVVPVDALLALVGGGYAVEQVTPGGAHRLVTVSLGLFDDSAGVVQVSGPGLAAGQHVVVPAT